VLKQVEELNRGLEMSEAAFNDDAEWYAVRTKRNEEVRAEVNLRSWQVQTFAPKLRELSTSTYGGNHYVSKPLFTSYIFARFNLGKQLHNVNYTRGVRSVVSFGGNPIRIDDNIIDLIKERLDEDGFVRLGEELTRGDMVTIKFGPLKSLVGIFQKRIKETDRVKILLNAVSYQNHVLLDREMIEKVAQA
jgi:transcriptional antiterminator RfaH